MSWINVHRFIFDVDGTLTPSRGKIDMDFGVFFTNFSAYNFVYLVTGSDKDKTIEQVGDEIYSFAKKVYNCSGSDVYTGNNNVFRNEWKLPVSAREWLEQELADSDFPLRTGLHIEDRPGMVNFSVVGRNATIGERKLYVEWDNENNERNGIAKKFKKQFPSIEAVVGGETGIDIYPVGADKGQILRDFHPQDHIHFFGDRMDNDGNDYPLKKALEKRKGPHNCYHVTDWKETFSILKDLKRQGIIK